MSNAIFRGELYYADLNPAIGSEQRGMRPVLVVQNDVGNKHSSTIIVAAITSRSKPKLPTHLPLSDVPGLRVDSVVLVEQLRTIDKRRLGKRIGTLSYVAMKLVDAALATSLDLPHPKNIMVLCGQCFQQFNNSDEYFLRRVDPNQTYKEQCTYCNVNTGFDYEIESHKG